MLSGSSSFPRKVSRRTTARSRSCSKVCESSICVRLRRAVADEHSRAGLDSSMSKFCSLKHHPSAKNVLLTVSDDRGSPKARVWDTEKGQLLLTAELSPGGVSPTRASEPSMKADRALVAGVLCRLVARWFSVRLLDEEEANLRPRPSEPFVDRFLPSARVRSSGCLDLGFRPTPRFDWVHSFIKS